MKNIKGIFVRGLRRLTHRGGHGVHSPFAFYLITNIVEERHPYYCFGEIEQVRHERIPNLLTEAQKRGIKPIKRKYGRLLFRLVNFFKPTTIIEVGKQWGLATLYLDSALTAQTHYVVVDDQDALSVVQQIVRDYTSRPTIIPTPLLDWLNHNDVQHPQFILIHRLDSLNKYQQMMAWIAQCATSEMVVLIEDIHIYPHAGEAWEQLKEMEEVRVSMDLYYIGILFFNTKLNKQDYIVSF